MKLKLMRLVVVLLLFFTVFASRAQSELIPYRKGKKWGYCNSEKKILIPCKYDSADVFYDCNRAFVKIKDKYGFIDGKGNLAIPAKYKSVGVFRSQNGQNCKAPVILKEKAFWIDTAGRASPPPKTFRTCDGPATLSAAGEMFEQNGKKGLRSLTFNDNGRGDTILPAIYENLSDDGVSLFAKLNGKWGMLGYANLKVVLPFEYVTFKPFHSYYLLESQIGLFGIVDKNGVLLLPVKYRSNIGYI